MTSSQMMLNPYSQAYSPYSQGYPPLQQGYPSQQQGYPSQQQGYPPLQQLYTQEDINKFTEMQGILERNNGTFPQSKYTAAEIEKFYEIRHIQKMQQMQQYPQQQLEEMSKYHNIISSQLDTILSRGYNDIIDPYHIVAALDINNSKKPLTQEQMNLFFKHLLKYTYRASASEISNHIEVNKRLAELKQLLLKLVPSTTTTP